MSVILDLTDEFRSKYAFVFFEAMSAISLLVCVATLPKSVLLHKRHAIRKWYHRRFGDQDRAKEHEEKEREQERLLKDQAEDTDHHHVPPDIMDELASPKERMVSAEV